MLCGNCYVISQDEKLKLCYELTIFYITGEEAEDCVMWLSADLCYRMRNWKLCY